MSKKNKPTRGQACRLLPEGTIVCFVKKSGRKMSVLSWPAMGGGCPVKNEEFVPVDESELSESEKYDLEGARAGMERYYPEER